MTSTTECESCGCKDGEEKCGRLEKTSKYKLDVYHSGCECHDSYALGGG